MMLYILCFAKFDVCPPNIYEYLGKVEFADFCFTDTHINGDKFRFTSPKIRLFMECGFVFQPHKPGVIDSDSEYEYSYGTSNVVSE